MKDQQKIKEDRQQLGSTEEEAKTTEKHLPATAKQANNGSFTRETEALGWYMGRKLRIK